MAKSFSSLVFLLLLVVLNQSASIQLGLEKTYLHFFLENGSLIGLVTAVVAIAWGNLNEQAGLISSSPGQYLKACFQVIRLPVTVLGDESQNLSDKWDIIARGYRAGVVKFVRSDLILMWDVFVGGLLLFGIVIGLLLWFLLIAPAQYFVFLFAGAPARSLGQFANEKHIARLDGADLKIEKIDVQKSIPDGWWDASFSQKPVAVSALISSLIFATIGFLI